jgi:hypothetical protein
LNADIHGITFALPLPNNDVPLFRLSAIMSLYTYKKMYVRCYTWFGAYLNYIQIKIFVKTTYVLEKNCTDRD